MSSLRHMLAMLFVWNRGSGWGWASCLRAAAMVISSVLSETSLISCSSGSEGEEQHKTEFVLEICLWELHCLCWVGTYELAQKTSICCKIFAAKFAHLLKAHLLPRALFSPTSKSTQRPLCVLTLQEFMNHWRRGKLHSTAKLVQQTHRVQQIRVLAHLYYM